MIALKKSTHPFFRHFRSNLSALLALGALAVPFVSQAQTTIFNDTFNSSALSTLNGTSTPGGTPTASSTSYDVATSKTGSCTITAGSPGYLRAKLSSGTTAGYMELQAIFTSTPVQLVNIGDSINITFTFTNSAGTLMSGGGGSDINIGLYNSGGVKPVAGSLNASGLSTATTYDTVGCSNWQGYVCQLVSNTLSSTIFTRPVQTNATSDADQDLVFSAGGTGLFNNPAGTTVGSSATSTLVLTSGSTYTESFTVLLSAANAVSITEKVYAGAGTGGTVLYSTVQNSSGGTTYTNFSNQYDGLAIGINNKGTSQNPQMDISQLTISKNVYSTPVINNLTNQTIIAGNNATLNPTVTGNPIPSFQWQTNNVNIGGATNSTLNLNNVQYAQNGYVYSLIASNAVNIVTNSMTLTVVVTPSISGLINQASLTNTIVTIAPIVSGIPTPSTQWQLNGVYLNDGPDVNGSIIGGSATSTLYITNTQVADTGSYSLVASNSAGIVTNTMSLLIATTNQGPVIAGPTSITVVQGGSGIFSATATGVPVPGLQWVDQTLTPINGANTGTLVLNNVQFSQNGYVYSLIATNSAGAATNGATLIVIVPPAITTQPVNLVVTNTQAASFSVVATGQPAPGYQWSFNNVPINGANGATYNIASAGLGSVGSYSCVITNQAGTTNTVSASLGVNSTMSAVAFTPANAQTGLCYDTPLSVTFNSTIGLGTNGTIKIYNVTNSTTPVDTINVVLGALQQRTFPGDSQTFTYPTINISGSTAVINPHFSVMAPNQTYYVTIDNGAFTDSAGVNFAGLTATNVWQFSTKVGGPLIPTNIVVNPNGSADFLSVQGAVNSIPSANTTPTIINIQNGLYTEIVDIAGKNNVIFRGQSRLGTLVGFANNATYQVVNGGSTHDRMAFKVDANGIALDNLTITNMTPQNGSQAEALMIESSAGQCIVNNCSIASRQDTILANVNTSQAYFNKSTVYGNFDYIWGGGNLYINQCIFDTVSGENGANLTAARTTTAATISTNFPWLNPSATYTANGMSFVNCTFTADPGAGPVSLADGNGTADELVSWYGCDFATNYLAPSASLFSGDYLFWQDNDTMTNAPVSFANVISISGTDPRLLAATNVLTWLYGWNPQLSPNITGQPAGQSASSGQPASFTVSATGIPDPSYQWQLNGVPITGATANVLNISSAVRTNGGNYTVVVYNGSGTVTSSVAALTYIDTPPVANGFSVGALLGVTETIPIIGGPNAPTDVDGDALTVSSVTPGANGTVTTDGANAIYTATSGASDSFTYTVSDGFGGSDTATVNVTINSNVSAYNQLSAATPVNGSTIFTFLGIPVDNYALDMTTDLSPPVSWTPVITNTPDIGGNLTFTNNTALPQSFFRARSVQVQ